MKRQPAVEVRDSAVHGRGVFALRELAAGTPIGRYAGRRYTAKRAAARDWDAELTYVFGLSDGSLIDGADGGNATRHLNHSCAPNCIAHEVEGADGRLQVDIEARRRIRGGAELFIDYRLQAADGDGASAYPCRCGSKRCRGTLLAVPPGRSRRRAVRAIDIPITHHDDKEPPCGTAETS